MSAEPEPFFDTNVLVYLFDEAYPDKQEVVRDLLRRYRPVVSAQVLGEFYVTVTRKWAQAWPPDRAATVVEQLRRFEVVPVTSRLVAAAIQTAMRAQVSYWDALIIESALSAGCTKVLSEDLNDGQFFGRVRVENPFTTNMGGAA